MWFNIIFPRWLNNYDSFHCKFIFLEFNRLHLVFKFKWMAAILFLNWGSVCVSTCVWSHVLAMKEQRLSIRAAQLSSGLVLTCVLAAGISGPSIAFGQATNNFRDKMALTLSRLLLAQPLSELMCCSVPNHLDADETSNKLVAHSLTVT